jgi:hypothetical protein
VKKLPIVTDHEEKTLMSEVLPQPQPSASGSPRQRTVHHMRRVLAAAAVAGIAATAARNSSGDAGPDGPETDGGGMDSMFVGHDPGPDAGGTKPDAELTDGHDGFDSMFVGHDPAGQGDQGGCSVGAPGRKGR